MGFQLIRACKQRLLKANLLLLMGLWQCGLLASEPITQFTNDYYESALLLSSNPDQLISNLEAKDLTVLEALERAQSHLLLSLAYNQQVLPQAAMLNAIEGRRLVSIENQPWLYHFLLLSQAQSLEHQGNQEKALPLANQVLQWAESSNHRRMLIQSLSVRGLIYNSMLNSTRALEDLQRAYAMAPQEDPFLPKALMAGYIGLIYEYRGEDQQAIPFFEQAVEYHRAHQRWRDLGDALYGLGRAYKNSGELQRGLVLIQESIEVAEKVNDLQGVAYGRKELASAYSKLGNKEKAQSTYLLAIETFKMSNNVSAIADITISVASVNLDMQKAEKAHKYLASAEKIIDPKNMLGHLLRLRYYQGKAFELQGEYELAYKAMMESYPQRLKMVKQQYSEKFESLKNQFELDKLDAENRLLEKDNLLKTNNLDSEKKKNQFLSLLVVMFLIIFSLLVFILIRGRQSKLKFKQLSQTDDLTGLANRRKAVHQLEYEISNAEKNKTTLAVALIDLDYFKQINDNFGHAVGDLVLVEFAALCRASLRGADIIGRIGGEEFLIGLPQTLVEDAAKLLDKIRSKSHKIADAFNLAETSQEKQLKVSVSIGITSARDGESAEKTISRADKALYSAKNSGRDQVVIG